MSSNHSNLSLVAVDMSSTKQIDWNGWMTSWDAQQRGYLPDREARFDAMFEILGALLPPDFVALDLACGPGSISQRLLARFPHAQSVAVDLDPVLLAIGRNLLRDHAGRLQWHDVDLCDPTWVEVLGEQSFHAVLTTTALHWLPVPELVRVYRQVAERMRPDGVLLNGDHMQFAPSQPTFCRIAEQVRTRTWAVENFAARGIQNWEAWWQALRAEAGVEALFAERERRFSWRAADKWVNPIYDLHKAALYEAGFREVDTIWQNLDNRILLAVK